MKITNFILDEDDEDFIEEEVELEIPLEDFKKIIMENFEPDSKIYRFFVENLDKDIHYEKNIAEFIKELEKNDKKNYQRLIFVLMSYCEYYNGYYEHIRNNGTMLN